MKMKLYETILLTLRYSDKGMIAGRTVLQKTLYFINEKMKLSIDFNAHYYGPFSSEISDEIASLNASGIISECVETFPSFSFGVSFEPRKYSYSLTDMGTKMAHIVQKQNKVDAKAIKRILIDMKEAGVTNDYKSLSIAAKMHHIVKAGKRMRPSEVLEEAKALEWKISEEEANASIEFLDKMGLIHIESS